MDEVDDDDDLDKEETMIFRSIFNLHLNRRAKMNYNIKHHVPQIMQTMNKKLIIRSLIVMRVCTKSLPPVALVNDKDGDNDDHTEENLQFSSDPSSLFVYIRTRKD